MIKLTLACVAFMAYAAAQATPPAAPAQPAGPKFKDDKEQTEAIAANTEKDPKAKLEKLDKWKADYPETQYDVQRTGLYFETYGQAKMYSEQIKTAQELRKKNAQLEQNLGLIRTIFQDYAQLKPPSADDMAAITEVSNYIIQQADTIFSAANKPKDQTDAAWTALKPQMIEFAKAQLDSVAEQQGRDAVIARLKADPTRVQLNQWLGGEILKDVRAHPEHAEMQSDAIFHYARAASYAGPGCLDPKGRAQAKSFVDRAYKQFHGSADGEDKLMEVAANQPLPDGFKIDSNVKMAEEAAAKDKAACDANPMLCKWKDTKAILTAPDGQTQFDSNIKDSELPTFTGKIVSMTPANRPKSVVVAVEKDGVADCTLTFAAALPGKMEPGETLTFTGVAKSFKSDPYMLTLEVDKDKLEGWTGKNAPARPAATKTKKGSN